MAEPLERYLRPEVQAFARAMEARLRANDHKGGWSTCRVNWLMNRIVGEFKELRTATTDLEISGEPGEVVAAVKAIAVEAADVANFAMMVADVAGALARDEVGQ